MYIYSGVLKSNELIMLRHENKAVNWFGKD